MLEERIGLVCFGGGICLVVFSLGVLRRFFYCGVKIDYVSCVFGGNYVVVFYLDWKYRYE